MIINHDSGPGLALAKTERWEEVKALRDVKIAEGCDVPGLGVVQTDMASMDNIAQAVIGATVAAITSQTYTLPFILADNTPVVLNGAQTMGMGQVTGERKSACHVHSQQLRAAIYAAVSKTALDAIDIEAGWPA